jgi:hypothetical protein
MEYKGKLYGRLGGRRYFDTGKTADDWDALEKRVAELEEENQALSQPLVSGALPLTIKGLDVEALANTIYEKWSLIIDGRRIMPKDLFTLAIQDIVRVDNDI